MSTACAMYVSFSDTALGGSQVAVVSDAAGIDRDTRQRIAKENGVPATCFVDEIAENRVTAQFFSTVTELPMCGHGTIGLMTRLDELDLIDWKGDDRTEAVLRLPTTDARIELRRQDNGRLFSALEVRPPTFRRDSIDQAHLARILGLAPEDLAGDPPIETAVGDFIHLVVAVRDLAAIRRIAPDFDAMVSFCHAIDVQTVAVFTTEVERPESTVHVRDFCPTVGVAESPAAGTTNAALTAYLVRNGLVHPNSDGEVRVTSEQGIEINKPSAIYTVAQVIDGKVETLKVGGVATKVLERVLDIPDAPKAAE